MAGTLEALARTSPSAGTQFTCHLTSGSYLHPLLSKREILSKGENHAAGVREGDKTTCTIPTPVASSPSTTTSSTAVPGSIVTASVAAVAIAAVETETRTLNRLGMDQPIEVTSTNSAAAGDTPSLSTPSMSSVSSISRQTNISLVSTPQSVSTLSNGNTISTSKNTDNCTPNTNASVNASAIANTTSNAGINLGACPNSSSDTTTASATATEAKVTPAASSHKSFRSSILAPFTSSPSVLHSTSDMIRDGLVRSADATTSFLYRTFSPTYRITRLYIDSWSNGSQRRGLKRIKDSVLRGDGFMLIKGSAKHMTDVWNQVMAAYRVKFSRTTPTTRTSLSTQGRNGSNHDRSNKTRRPKCEHDSDSREDNSNNHDDSNDDGSGNKSDRA